MSTLQSQRPTPQAKRPNRQQLAAAATRQEILQAARRLFAERGYAQTSIAEIAEAAGVSVPTIYASVGPKPAIVATLVAICNLGVGGKEALARVEVETDPTALLALGPRVNRALSERFGDILGILSSAAEVEPTAAEALTNGRRMHDYAARRNAKRLHTLGVLRPGVSASEAAAVMAFLTNHEHFSTLVDRYGWSFDRAEEWMNATLRALLLKE